MFRFLLRSFIANQPAGRASVVPGFAAVTVNVFTRFEAGKRVFFKSKYYIEEYDKKHKEK